jgi:hypothetical protein
MISLLYRVLIADQEMKQKPPAFRGFFAFSDRPSLAPTSETASVPDAGSNKYELISNRWSL